MRSGTQLRALPKHGMVHLGFRRRPELTTQLQARRNADLNAIRDIPTKTVPASTRRLCLARGFRQTLSGTRLQASRKTGTAQLGHRQRPELTTQLPALRSADTNAKPTTTGTARIRPAMLQNRR